MGKTTKLLISEFLASFLLGFFGLGIVVQFAILGAVKDLFQFGAAFGIIIAFVIILFNPISGAHFNPSATLAFAIFKGFDKKLVLPFWLVQTLGWGVGVGGVYIMYNTVLSEWTAETGGNAALLFYCTAPQGNLVAAGAVEFVMTALLIFAIFAMIDPRIINRPPNAAFPWLVALLIVFVVCFGGGFTGTSLNFARDMGPRFAGLIYGLIVGADVSPIFAGGQWIVYTLCTLAGGVFGGFFFEKVMGAILPAAEES